MAKKRTRSAESWRYVLKADRMLPEKEQTVWILRPLTQAERAEVQDNFVRLHHMPSGGTVVERRDHRQTLELCLTNIEDVENFPGDAPTKLKWPANPDDHNARAAFLEQVDDADVHEIGNEIWAQAVLGDSVKNSSPPEGTSLSGGASEDKASTTAAAAATV
jgi:hypothetical protein